MNLPLFTTHRTLLPRIDEALDKTSKEVEQCTLTNSQTPVSDDPPTPPPLEEGGQVSPHQLGARQHQNSRREDNDDGSSLGTPGKKSGAPRQALQRQVQDVHAQLDAALVFCYKVISMCCCTSRAGYWISRAE